MIGHGNSIMYEISAAQIVHFSAVSSIPSLHLNKMHGDLHLESGDILACRGGARFNPRFLIFSHSFEPGAVWGGREPAHIAGALWS